MYFLQHFWITPLYLHNSYKTDKDQLAVQAVTLVGVTWDPVKSVHIQMVDEAAVLVLEEETQKLQQTTMMLCLDL